MPPPPCAVVSVKWKGTPGTAAVPVTVLPSSVQVDGVEDGDEGGGEVCLDVSTGLRTVAAVAVVVIEYAVPSSSVRMVVNSLPMRNESR